MLARAKGCRTGGSCGSTRCATRCCRPPPSSACSSASWSAARSSPRPCSPTPGVGRGDLRGRHPARLPRAAGRVPAARGDRRGGQHAHRHRLRIPRPESEGVMTSPLPDTELLAPAVEPVATGGTRAGRGTWHAFRRAARSGMVSLGILRRAGRGRRRRAAAGARAGVVQRRRAPPAAARALVRHRRPRARRLRRGGLGRPAVAARRAVPPSLSRSWSASLIAVRRGVRPGRGQRGRRRRRPDAVAAGAAADDPRRGAGRAEHCTTIILVIAAFSWPEVTRLVRSQALSVVHLPYVDAARLMANRHGWIIGRHIIPAVAPVIVVSVVRHRLAGGALRGRPGVPGPRRPDSLVVGPDPLRGPAVRGDGERVVADPLPLARHPGPRALGHPARPSRTTTPATRGTMTADTLSADAATSPAGFVPRLPADVLDHLQHGVRPAPRRPASTPSSPTTRTTSPTSPASSTTPASARSRRWSRRRGRTLLLVPELERAARRGAGRARRARLLPGVPGPGEPVRGAGSRGRVARPGPTGRPDDVDDAAPAGAGRPRVRRRRRLGADRARHPRPLRQGARGDRAAPGGGPHHRPHARPPGSRWSPTRSPPAGRCPARRSWPRT